MRCPFCHAEHDRVVDSRPTEDGWAVRRRRACGTCGRRFTTYERVEPLSLVVVKRSGAREPFDPEKLRAGVERAVAGSVIEAGEVERLVSEVEERARAAGPEVASDALGLAVLERLRLLDPVSYVRFASVYKGFDQLDDFEREVVALQKGTEPKAPSGGRGRTGGLRRQPLQ